MEASNPNVWVAMSARGDLDLLFCEAHSEAFLCCRDDYSLSSKKKKLDEVMKSRYT